MAGSEAECHERCFIKARRLRSSRRVAVRDLNTHVYTMCVHVLADAGTLSYRSEETEHGFF